MHFRLEAGHCCSAKTLGNKNMHADRWGRVLGRILDNINFMVEVLRQGRGPEESEENLGEDSGWRPCFQGSLLYVFFLAKLSHLAAKVENTDSSVSARLGSYSQKETECAVGRQLGCRLCED